MEKGDLAVVVKESARMVVGTVVEILYVSTVENDPKPLWARNHEGLSCAWYAPEELQKMG